MKRGDQQLRLRKFLFSARRYLIFFLLMSFVISCCMILFLDLMSKSMNIALTETMIGDAAKITFGNVVLLSFLCTVVDGMRRKLMVERPVRRIINAAEKIMNGEFSTRIEPFHSMNSMDGFDTIIEYFNKMAEELSGTETLRTDFIANVSHELKTPLSVIQNYGTLLQKPELPEEKRIEYAKEVTAASRRLADLITNILKLNKLENQQIFPEKQTFNLGEQLCECLLAFEDAWEKKELEIETEIEDEVFVQSDAELLTLVWNNLFSNAVKFTPQGGKITLRLETEGAFAQVIVQDTGCGINPEEGAHIFEKFYQGDTSHSTSGNGLGLALVKRVMDIMGGDISVDSQVSVGSSFTVRLRRKENEAA